MIVEKTKFEGVFIIEARVFGDARGWFMETYSKIKTPQIDCVFVQDNHSYSSDKGTLRGIHFQHPPMAQAKLVRCTRGAILDVVVDLRAGSDTYKQWISFELSADNKKQIFLPRGFGHGFLTLCDHTEVLYKTDNYYSPERDGAIHWADPEINVDWGISNPILSEKDSNAPLLKEKGAIFHVNQI
jgi:dTDP-4-dehydrorhamnose 3,5-epimerase